jgi:hypothetical protein
MATGSVIGRVIAPLVALVVAVLAAVLGKQVSGSTLQQIGTHTTAVLVGLLGAVHAPTAVRKVRQRKRRRKPPPAFVDMLDTIGPDASNIPGSCRKMLAYITGPGIAWTSAQIRAAKERGADLIAVDQSDNTYPYAQYRTLVKDVEPGASTNEAAVIQAGRRAKLRLRTTLYTFAANEAALRHDVESAGLQSWTDWLIADWNLSREQAIRRLEVDRTLIGIQWASPTSNPDTICPGSRRTLRELNVDLSVTRGLWT